MPEFCLPVGMGVVGAVTFGSILYIRLNERFRKPKEIIQSEPGRKKLFTQRIVTEHSARPSVSQSEANRIRLGVLARSGHQPQERVAFLKDRMTQDQEELSYLNEILGQTQEETEEN